MASAGPALPSHLVNGAGGGGRNDSGISGVGARSVSLSIPAAQPRPRRRNRRTNGPDDDNGQASLASSTANLLNTIVGTGMVAIPGALVYTGWLLGVLLIVLCGCTGASGLYLLTRCANKLGGRRQSFFTVALKTIPKGARWFDLAIALKCYGVSISYLIISGQLMPQVVLSFLKAAGHEHEAIPRYLLDRDFWVTALLVILLPLCFLRKLDSLRHTSYLSLAAVVYLVVIVVFFFFSTEARARLPPRGEIHWIVFSPHILPIFPVFVFAFTCAQNMLPVYNELSASDPLMHLDRAKWAIGASIGGAGAVYSIVAVLGYLEFGSNLGDNIIAMYPSSSIFVAVGRLSIVLLTIFSYPLQVHPCRAAVDKVIYPPRAVELPTDEEGNDGDERDDNDDDNEASQQESYEALLRSAAAAASPDEIPLGRWTIITACIVSTAFVVALLVDDLSIILGFVGSLGSTTISFILPGILYSSLHGPSDRLRRPAQVLAGWGFLVGAVALVANILKLLHAGVAVGAEAKADRLAGLIERWHQAGN